MASPITRSLPIDVLFVIVQHALLLDIASLWGFDHMGRFAVEYRRRFGERPSDTRASARRARPGLR